MKKNGKIPKASTMNALTDLEEHGLSTQCVSSADWVEAILDSGALASVGQLTSTFYNAKHIVHSSGISALVYTDYLSIWCPLKKKDPSYYGRGQAEFSKPTDKELEYNHLVLYLL